MLINVNGLKQNDVQRGVIKKGRGVIKKRRSKEGKRCNKEEV